MAAVFGRKLLCGDFNRGFLPSFLQRKLSFNDFLMSTARGYTYFTGTSCSSTRNLFQTFNDQGTLLTRYVSQKTRSVHSHKLLSSPTHHGRPCLHSSSIFISLKKELFTSWEFPSSFGVRFLPTLNQYRRGKAKTKAEIPEKHVPKSKRILLGPQRKGVCVKVFTRKPKKPNSGNRKCALLKLSNGKVITAYIPGEKAALQEHGVVLFEGGRVQDCPGIKYKIIRGKYDMN
ncbi:uncharacterized protein [Montipora foliosa]|uniref:uncharacterized protein n=1 Tax=Montipora foliosa TaxID=591990 RepID=UPI0035F166A1